MHAQSLCHVWLFVTPWTVACQPPLSVGFLRQEYWSGLPFLSPGDHPDLGIKATFPVSPALPSRVFTTEEALLWMIFIQTERPEKALSLAPCWSNRKGVPNQCIAWVTVNGHSSRSIQFSRSVVSDSLRPHGRQHARLPCPSPTPRAYSNSCPSSQWCHPTISSIYQEEDKSWGSSQEAVHLFRP